MSLYRYYFFTRLDRLLSGNAAVCDGDTQALAFGQALLDKEGCAEAIETWHDERFVGGCRRDGVPYVTTRTSDSVLRSHPMFALDKKTA